MPDPSPHFPDFEALNAYILDKEKDGLLVTYCNCEGYAGMVLGIMIVFDTRQDRYELDLQWASFGLDLYGDTLQESYVYRFESLESLLAYLKSRYTINVTDIPLNYKIDQSQFPSPLKEEEKKPLYEAAWQRFQEDFRRGDFLDPSLQLVYSTV